MSQARIPAEVFYVYAPEDEYWQQELDKHLVQLKRQHVISTWHARQISAGEDWRQASNTYLQRAQVILLLISPDFLASDYCYSAELQALERSKAGKACVIPILLRPVDWQDAPFAHLPPLPRDKTFLSEAKNLDRAFADIAFGIHRAISALFPQVTNRPGTDFPVWNIPFSRNPFFTGRESELIQLRAQLQRGQTQAISGLGGIGKTQLAVEYAYRHAQDYQAVLWACADTPGTLNSSYSEIAELLKLPKKNKQKQDLAIQAVKTWLQTCRGWLLILDNADNPTVLPAFLPPVIGGHLIITTRSADLSMVGLGLKHPLAVETLTNEQGAYFLLYRAGLLAQDATLAQAAPQNRQLALHITQELGNLPLALDQAGAYLKATGSNLATYLQIYQQRRADLLKERRGQDHPEPVATTWDISFQNVEIKHPEAAELLRFCAFLPDAIPEEILAEGAKELGPMLTPVAADAYKLDRAIEALRAYSLISRDSHEHTLTVHCLVQAVLLDRLSSEAQQEWMQRIVLVVNAALPYPEFADWPVYERCLPHALLCATWINQMQLTTLEAACLLLKTALYLDDRARCEEAKPLCQRVQAIYEELLGAEHPDTAISMNNLALIYYKQEEYAKAKLLFLRALAICKQQLGAEHFETATCLNNLALVYYKQEEYAKAELLFQRVLAIRERQLGTGHPDTAQSLNNLGELYRSQERYAEAEPLLQRALATREEQLGTGHPYTAQSQNNLASLYAEQGKYAESDALYQRALATLGQVLGEEHPRTRNARKNYARLQQLMQQDRE